MLALVARGYAVDITLQGLSHAAVPVLLYHSPPLDMHISNLVPSWCCLSQQRQETGLPEEVHLLVPVQLADLHFQIVSFCPSWQLNEVCVIKPPMPTLV